MWTEARNNSRTIVTNTSNSKMVDPDFREHLLHTTVQQRNVSTAAAATPPPPPPPPWREDSLSRSSGIIPGLIAATVFIAFLLGLYAVLWKCMVSPPKRKHSKVRVRVQQRTTV